MRNSIGLCTLSLICVHWVGSFPVLAHEGHEHESATSESSPSLPPALILPEIEGPKPWSDAPHLNAPERFHFAIMTDNTGGHRPGIWMQGVRTVNLLRPEFVVSVGDLIEGYTEDPTEIETQWKEFLGFIDQMEMKFFFVAGNHDVTNPVMHKHWREHFGREWYSFDYKKVHFMCLCSEDPAERIGQEQLRWIREDLEKHEDARWTLLFFHKPLWTYAEREMAAGNADSTNWKQVEQLLGSRPHTVFSGHVHHYVQYERNGMQYYHLATTGGGSQLRGIPYGEFDHVTWVTMEPEGPRVAHLLLDGVLAPDRVTEKGIARFRAFLGAAKVDVAPILVRSEHGFDEGVIHVRLQNEFDREVRVTGQIAGLPLQGLTLDPEAITLQAPAREAVEVGVRVRFTEPIQLDRLRYSTLTAKLTTIGEEPPLSAEQSIPVIIDREYLVPQRANEITLDGAIEDWDAFPYATGDKPLVTWAAETWQGSGDGSLAFHVVRDDAENLVIAAKVTDDVILERDGVEFVLDASPANADGAGNGNGLYRFQVSAPRPEAPSAVEVRLARGRILETKSSVVGKAGTDGYSLELRIPRELLDEPQGGSWSRFRMAAVLYDQDEATGGRPRDQVARIHWRGTERIQNSMENLAYFAKE